MPEPQCRVGGVSVIRIAPPPVGVRSGTAALRLVRRIGSFATPKIAAERGMVTVELVFGLLIVSMMMAVFGWAILLFGVQVGCIDTAKDVARQAARDDQQAVKVAESQAPHGAKIDISGSGPEITVVVQVRSKPFDFVPSVTLTAKAIALREPGGRG